MALTATDDDFHLGTSGDGSWTETAWFAAQVPERGLCVWTYPLFRHELGVMSCGIYVWGPGTEELWELPYYRTWWHLPIPDGIRATGFELANGLSYECLDPLTRYRVRYTDGEAIEFDTTFTALHPPHEVGVEPGGHGHFDQFGRVTGELTLNGERLEIDCVEMRDRTWSPRRESRQGAYVSYSYGASPSGSGFHASTRYSPRKGRATMLTGYVLRDGQTRALADAHCAVDRDERGRPVRVRVEGTEAGGATLEATGEVVSRLAMPSTPWFVWACVVRWTLPDGSEALGEHQDTWSPGLLRRFLRAGRLPAGD